MDKLYFNCTDLQGTNWAYDIATLHEWLDRACGWCECDDMFELENVLLSLNENDLITTINETWGIRLQPIEEMTLRNYMDIVENYYNLKNHYAKVVKEYMESKLRK